MKTRSKPRRTSRGSRRGPATGTTGVYRGKQAKTGNSLGLRFERALFHSHPEFNGEVEARIIGPGRMLVVANNQTGKASQEDDPVLSSFLSFLAADMARSPQKITPLDSSLMARIDKLVDGVEVSLDGDLGDEALI